MQANGGKAVIGTAVTQIITKGGKATGIKTDKGDVLDFDVIVDCTGPWSRFTGEMVGLDIPIAHQGRGVFPGTSRKEAGLCVPGAEVSCLLCPAGRKQCVHLQVPPVHGPGRPHARRAVGPG